MSTINTPPSLMNGSLILFAEDWDRPENARAIVDYNTTNKSFLIINRQMKEMNINNCDFMLQLHTPELSGVDPFSPYLTTAQKRLILYESSFNIWYIVRELIKVMVPGLKDPAPFGINRASLAILWSVMMGITFFVILQRQIGKTVTLSTIIALLINFIYVNTKMNLITKDSKVRSETVEKVKFALSNLPPYLRFFNEAKNKGNESLHVDFVNNGLLTHIAQKSKLAAEQVGRGLTSPFNLFDEASFLYNMKETLTAATSSGTAAREIANEVGKPFGTGLFSTAGYLHTDTGKFAKKIYDGGFRFTEDLYDAPNKETVREIIEHNSTGLGDVLIIEFSHRQLNKTDKWLRRVIRENMANPLKAMTEFMNIWSNASSSSALKPKQIKKLNEHTKDPDHTTMHNLMMFRWYCSPEKRIQYMSRPFVIGIDSSDMLDSDSTAVCMIDPVTGETICTASYRLSLITDFEIAISEFMLMYPKSVLIMEAKSSAMAILDSIFTVFRKKNINIFERVFNWVVSEDLEHTVFTNDDYLENKRHFGYKTGGGTGKNSRIALYDRNLYRVADTFYKVLYDKDLVSDMCKLEEKDSKITHTSLNHDDRVIARLLCDWLIVYGAQLERYGINPNTVLVSIGGNKDADNQNDIKLTKEINALMNELERVSGINKLLLKTKISKLKRKLTSKAIDSFNKDTRFNKIIKDKGIVKEEADNVFFTLPSFKGW